MKVCAIIVTRGDHNDGVQQILDSLPVEWERIVWDNGFHGWPHIDHYQDGNDWRPNGHAAGEIKDLSVYGRYAAIKHTTAELIYVQDDDCVVSDPMEIVGCLAALYESRLQDPHKVVVCNMPAEFRHDFYEDHALVGFGAAFHRSAPDRAFEELPLVPVLEVDRPWMFRTCDIVFTGLTQRVLVDVPKVDLPWASDPDRMWMQPEHQAERARMRELVRAVRNLR